MNNIQRADVTLLHVLWMTRLQFATHQSSRAAHQPLCPNMLRYHTPFRGTRDYVDAIIHRALCISLMMFRLPCALNAARNTDTDSCPIRRLRFDRELSADMP
jgi:hypothetical protein